MSRVTIKGLQEAQRANQKAMAAVKPSGGLGRAMQYLTADALRLSIMYTHVDTGALKASHRSRQEGSARWRIYIDPTAKNPRSGTRTSVYGAVEHARGGEHQFYGRTYQQGAQLARRASVYLLKELP